MSAGEGVALVRYQGQRLRRPAIAAAGSQEIAYQVIIRDWIRKVNGTVLSTAFRVRLQASPAPVSCCRRRWRARWATARSTARWPFPGSG